MIPADVLGERARLTPEAPALVVLEPPLRLSYRQLDERAVRCAAAWHALGVGQGERVAILAHNRVEYLDAFCAAGKSGVILVTLGTRLTAHELQPILDDAGARLVLYDGSFAETVGALRERCAAVERWIALDAPADSVDLSYAELCAAAEPAAFVPARCAPEDVYCLLYTSGTTGRP
jgi:fatty-acyl-CoA synthase